MDDTERIMDTGYILPSTNSNINTHSMKGLGLITTVVFIVGEMTGTGILSLPKAVLQSDWSGIGLIVGCCLLSGYCGIRLADCWNMMLEKNESLTQGARDPFPLIAYEAAGKIGRYLVLASSYLQLFGAGVIFLLLAAENIASLLQNKGLYFCDWTLVIAAVMFPVCLLGTPKDFWPIAVGAMVCTGVAVVFIVIEAIIETPDPLPPHTPITASDYFLAFGTILFCWGGAVMFPTIQTDMKNPTKFPKAVFIAYLVMLIFFYLPVGICCFIVFGNKINDNIITNLDDNWRKTVVLVLITGHLLTAFNIILNPVFQGVEQALNAPTKFSTKRVIVRGCVLICVLFVAQSVPNFGPILSFIGGSTISLSSFILPCVFYWLLCRQPKYHKNLSKLELLTLAVSILISSVGGVASTYFSLNALFSPETFHKPCYLNRTQTM